MTKMPTDADVAVSMNSDARRAPKRSVSCVRISKSDPEVPMLCELIDLDQAATCSGLSASHLRLLVRRGDIWGKKMGRTWFTTELEVKQYVSGDRKPGPKKG